MTAPLIERWVTVSPRSLALLQAHATGDSTVRNAVERVRTGTGKRGGALGMPQVPVSSLNGRLLASVLPEGSADRQRILRRQPAAIPPEVVRFLAAPEVIETPGGPQTVKAPGGVVRSLLSHGFTVSEAATILGVSRETVYKNRDGA